jgi:hypothetical protein
MLTYTIYKISEEQRKSREEDERLKKEKAEEQRLKVLI